MARCGRRGDTSQRDAPTTLITDHFSLITPGSGSRPGCRTSPGRGYGAWRGRWPRRSRRRNSSRSRGGSCRCSGSGRCRRGRRRWRRATGWRYTNKIDILFVLSPRRVEIVGSRVGNVPSSVIRHDGDIIAYLVLDWIAFERGKRIAHRHIGRPRNAAIGAVRVKQLGVSVVCSVA
jgi:hypothetical protein